MWKQQQHQQPPHHHQTQDAAAAEDSSSSSSSLPSSGIPLVHPNERVGYHHLPRFYTMSNSNISGSGKNSGSGSDLSGNRADQEKEDSNHSHSQCSSSSSSSGSQQREQQKGQFQTSSVSDDKGNQNVKSSASGNNSDGVVETVSSGTVSSLTQSAPFPPVVSSCKAEAQTKASADFERKEGEHSCSSLSDSGGEEPRQQTDCPNKPTEHTHSQKQQSSQPQEDSCSSLSGSSQEAAADRAAPSCGVAPNSTSQVITLEVRNHPISPLSCKERGIASSPKNTISDNNQNGTDPRSPPLRQPSAKPNNTAKEGEKHNRNHECSSISGRESDPISSFSPNTQEEEDNPVSNKPSTPNPTHRNKESSKQATGTNKATTTTTPTSSALPNTQPPVPKENLTKELTDKLSTPKELENHRTVAKSLSARPRSSRSLLQNLSQKAESCTPHPKPRAKKRREKLLNAETLDELETNRGRCSSTVGAYKTTHNNKNCPEDQTSTSPVTKPPRKLKPRSQTYSSVSTCSNSTLSTKSHYHQILGIAVHHHKRLGDDDDSFYSKASSSSSSSFFYRFGWYQSITGVGGFWLACVLLVIFFTLLTFVIANAATTAGASSLLYSMSSTAQPTGPPLQIVVATRLHNRQATHPLTDDAVRHKIREFRAVCVMADAVQGVIAVDAEDTNLLQQVQNEVQAHTTLHALPITPWGRFVPALNALIGYAASLGGDNNDNSGSTPNAILFVSAETSATRESIQTLVHHMLEHNPKPDNPASGLARLRSSKLAPPPPRMDNSTLVVGARLAGHDYQNVLSETTAVGGGKDKNEGTDDETALEEARAVDLNGRTTPWNTLALWNLKKLATTGFLMLSEGYLTPDVEPSYGVEEVVTIALLQQLLGREQAVAKLVPVPGVSWDADFADPERQQWHQSKMESKLSRADRQMKIAKLTGVVHHYQ